VDRLHRQAGAHLHKETAMAVSDDLMRLSVRAKQAEDHVTAAKPPAAGVPAKQTNAFPGFGRPALPPTSVPDIR
jgi:hypothetical protein